VPSPPLIVPVCPVPDVVIISEPEPPVSAVVAVPERVAVRPPVKPVVVIVAKSVSRVPIATSPVLLLELLVTQVLSH